MTHPPVQDRFAIHPDWIVPVDAAPIPNGYVVIDRGRIAYVAASLQASDQDLNVIRVPGHALLPGLVNAHCHLEFSDCDAPFPAGDSFPSWIQRVIQHRRNRVELLSKQVAAPEHLTQAIEQQRRRAIEAGIQESYGFGVRWIVDMVTSPWRWDWNRPANDSIGSTVPPPIVQPCIELMDVHPMRAEETQQFLNQCIDEEDPQSGFPRLGLAPHAPYTASLDLLHKVVKHSVREQRMVCMHLAESPEEDTWLDRREGPFGPLLEPIASTHYLEHIGRIDQHLALLERCPRALIVHGNYLSSDAITRLASRRDHLGLVYCPRTHHHFAWANYELPSKLQAGVRIFLGTDSRSTNPDLNLWEEARWVYRLYPDLPASVILGMITHEPAQFLGIDDQLGTLRPGCTAHLSLAACSLAPVPKNANAIAESLLDEATQVHPMESLLSRFL